MQHLRYNRYQERRLHMRRYKQLSLQEREELYALLKAGFSLGDIAKKLKRNKGTLSRELHRNSKGIGQKKSGGVYIPCKAQEKAKRRALLQRQQAPWKGPTVYLYVRDHLRRRWSPEEIAGRLPKDHPGLSICSETIYQKIYHRDNKKDKLWRFLTVQRKKRMKKNGRAVHRESRIPEAISIDKRPKTVLKRKQVGHWESDNVIGKKTDKTALSVTVERKLRLTLIAKLSSKTANEKSKKLFLRMTGFPKKMRRTLTVDNGAENAYHKKITQSLEMLVFFCHAYHSWEKGTNENTNGRLRRYIPKGVSIDQIDEETIQAIEWEMNNTPRKCLDFKTPLEALEEVLYKSKTTNRCTSS